MISLVIFASASQSYHLLPHLPIPATFFSKHTHMHVTQAHTQVHMCVPDPCPCCENTFCCALSCTPPPVVLFMENDDF